MLAGMMLTGCDEQEPVDSGNNYADGGGSVLGGTLGDAGGTGTPDSGSPPVNDAGGFAIGDAGSGTLDAGARPDAASADSGGPSEAGADAGSGTTADAGDASTGADAATPDAGGPPPHADLGKGDGSDVVMIGDSWMSLVDSSSGIEGGILKASGQPYRAYAIPGTTLLGGGIIDILTSPIPDQWTQAVQADRDIKTVIMTAGGNDILQTGLQDDCNMQGDACGEQVTKILDALSALWAQMAKDGVQDLVYILYATPEGKSVDFLLPSGDGAEKRCAEVPAPMRCHTLATLDIVMGDIPDDIHPSQAASDRIGKAVFDLMTTRGMRR
jgi:hypothetical protein